MRPVFKIIIFYEIFFFIFWNILYFSSSDIENWFEAKILEAIYTILTTMILGFVLIYVIYISAKLTGILDKIKTVKDPRKN
tara:strand:+ start:105 stop:347 length:243 start_codon:yes stop_codon:yes gene_type:complete